MISFFSDYQAEKTIQPGNAIEVQQIINKANRDCTPVVPVSSGTNLQDTHLPSVNGAFAIDLSRMKGIYFDALNKNAVIEPGVTFEDLEKVCKKDGLRTLSAIDVPRNASVLATYLEMMPLFGWIKYHPWEMLTMEGYRADGHKFATGQMAMNQDRPDKYSWGVSYAQVARLFCQAQGTLGIITKAAVTLKTAMPKSQVLFFSCKNINQALKALKAFMFAEETHEIFAVNRTYLNELLDIKALSGMPPWTVVIVIRGFDKEEIEYKHKDISHTANDLRGSINCSLYGVPNASSAILSEMQFPTGIKLHSSKHSWVPFVTIATSKQIEIADNLFPKNSGAILMPLQSGGCFYYQPDMRYRESEKQKARELYVDISLRLLKMGVLFPRPSALIAKQCAKHYPVNFKVLRSIKKTIDPKNIMNPGKLGF